MFIDREGNHHMQEKYQDVPTAAVPISPEVVSLIIELLWQVYFQLVYLYCSFDRLTTKRCIASGSWCLCWLLISHKMPDGIEKPIAIASRMLTKAEKNYSQIEQEALGLVFGVMKFQEDLFGRKLPPVTDHKPLLKVLSPKTRVPPVSAARMQRWYLILAACK